MTSEQLREPGPARSAATAAIVGTLRMDLTVCRDRAEAIAPRILDRALDAADATRPLAPRRPSPPTP